MCIRDRYYDGLAQYEDGKKQLAAARAQLEDGWATLQDKKVQMADARRQIDDAKGCILYTSRCV